MQGSAVNRAVHRHGADTHLSTGTNDSQGDFTPICYQKLANGHGGPL